MPELEYAGAPRESTEPEAERTRPPNRMALLKMLAGADMAKWEAERARDIAHTKRIIEAGCLRNAAPRRTTPTQRTRVSRRSAGSTKCTSASGGDPDGGDGDPDPEQRLTVLRARINPTIADLVDLLVELHQATQ